MSVEILVIRLRNIVFNLQVLTSCGRNNNKIRIHAINDYFLRLKKKNVCIKNNNKMYKRVEKRCTNFPTFKNERKTNRTQQCQFCVINQMTMNDG